MFPNVGFPLALCRRRRKRVHVSRCAWSVTWRGVGYSQRKYLGFRSMVELFFAPSPSPLILVGWKFRALVYFEPLRVSVAEYFAGWFRWPKSVEKLGGAYYSSKLLGSAVRSVIFAVIISLPGSRDNRVQLRRAPVFVLLSLREISGLASCRSLSCIARDELLRWNYTVL